MRHTRRAELSVQWKGRTQDPVENERVPGVGTSISAREDEVVTEREGT